MVNWRANCEKRAHTEIGIQSSDRPWEVVL